MDESSFAVETGANTRGVGSSGAGALGDLTGSAPAADATWRGLMVGTGAQDGNNLLQGNEACAVFAGRSCAPDLPQRDNLLQGDATLTFTAADNQIDATFSDIKNLDRNTAHSVTEVRFRDVPVRNNGRYRQGAGADKIEGAFYGTGHAETAGVFEQQGIVGAYGAKKQ